MTLTKARNLLVYGATGKAGNLVVERALSQGWAVTAFVRNPNKIPEALRSKVTVVKGDLYDAAAISGAVRACRPNAIVDASSALPFGQAKRQPVNNADRGVINKATVEALDADGRLTDCVLLSSAASYFPSREERSIAGRSRRWRGCCARSSRGTLRPEPTLNNIQHGRVSYVDVAEALVRLAGDEKRTWERKALFFNYASPES